MAKIDWSAHHESGEVLISSGGDWTAAYDEGGTTEITCDADAAAFGSQGLKFYIDSDKYNVGWVQYSGLPSYTEGDIVHVSFYFKLDANFTWSDGDATYLVRFGHDVDNPYDGLAYVWVTHSQEKLYIYYTPGERGVQCNTTIELDKWYHVELEISLATSGAVMSCYVNGVLDGQTTGFDYASYVEGNDWSELTVFRRFERTLDGESAVYFDAIRVGNDGMIGEYPTPINFNNPGRALHTISDSNWYLDRGTDEEYSFLDSSNKSNRELIRSYVSDSSTYAVIVSDGTGELWGYIKGVQTETLGDEVLTDPGFEDWAEVGPTDPAGDLEEWEENNINETTRQLSRSNTTLAPGTTGSWAAKIEHIDNTVDPQASRVRETVGSGRTTIGGRYRMVFRYNIISLEDDFGNQAVWLVCFTNASWAIIKRITLTSATDGWETSIVGATVQQSVVYPGVEVISSTEDGVVYVDDWSLKRILASNGVSICSRPDGSGEGAWNAVDQGGTFDPNAETITVSIYPITVSGSTVKTGSGMVDSNF